MQYNFTKNIASSLKDIEKLTQNLYRKAKEREELTKSVLRITELNE